MWNTNHLWITFLGKPWFFMIVPYPFVGVPQGNHIIHSRHLPFLHPNDPPGRGGGGCSSGGAAQGSCSGCWLGWRSTWQCWNCFQVLHGFAWFCWRFFSKRCHQQPPAINQKWSCVCIFLYINEHGEYSSNYLFSVAKSNRKLMVLT